MTTKNNNMITKLTQLPLFSHMVHTSRFKKNIEQRYAAKST